MIFYTLKDQTTLLKVVMTVVAAIFTTVGLIVTVDTFVDL